MARVYHWKHGWIPLDHVALKRGGHPTQAQGPIAGASKTEHSLHHPHPETGIKNRRQLAGAIQDLHSITDPGDKRRARAEIHAAAARLGATDLTKKALASGNRVQKAQAGVNAAQTKLDNVNRAARLTREANTVGEHLPGVTPSRTDIQHAADLHHQAAAAQRAAGNATQAARHDQRAASFERLNADLHGSGTARKAPPGAAPTKAEAAAMSARADAHAARQRARNRPLVPTGPTVGSPPSRSAIARHTSLGDRNVQARSDLEREARFGPTPAARAAAQRKLDALDRANASAPDSQARLRAGNAGSAAVNDTRVAARQARNRDAVDTARAFSRDQRVINAIQAMLIRETDTSATVPLSTANARDIITKAGLDPLKILRAFSSRQARRKH